VSQMTGADTLDAHINAQNQAAADQAAAISRANALQNSSRFQRMLEEGNLTPQQQQDLEIARQSQISAEINRMLAGDRDEDRMSVAIDPDQAAGAF